MLQKFEYPYTQQVVRLAKVDELDVPWFVARDICDVLSVRDVSMAVAPLDDDEKGLYTVPTRGGPQKMSIVSEAGLYTLILRSRKAGADTFRRWVTHDLLPSLRRAGRLMMPLDKVAGTPSHSEWVYFIRSGDAVKIGRSTNIEGRLTALQTSSPGKLKLLATVPGGSSVEKELHQKFHRFRLEGEWFAYQGQVRDYISSISGE